MADAREVGPEPRASLGHRIGLLAKGAGNFLVPLGLAGLCSAAASSVGLLIYPYLRHESWFRDAAAVVTAATVFSVLTRFWAAVKAGIGHAVARLARGCRQVRLAFGPELRDAPAVQRSGRSSAGETKGLVGVTLALAVGVLCLFVISLAIAVNLVESDRVTVPVEDLRLGGSPTFRSTVFFSEEAKFADWARACSLDMPAFEGYSSGVLEFLQPFGRCAIGASEPLLLRLHGFASSSGLEWPPDTSNLDECEVWKSCLARERCRPNDRGGGVERECVEDAFNVCVAEERARQVARWIPTLGPIGDSFDIDVVRWSSYRKMAAGQIVDRENDVYDGAAGVINRRVELSVVDTGTCQVVAQESDEDGLPGRKFARAALAWTDDVYGRVSTLGNSLGEDSRSTRPAFAEREAVGGAEGSWKMNNVSPVDGAVLVGLLAILVSVYLALDKRLRRVEDRSRKLRHRMDVLEGSQTQVIARQRGLSRNWTIALSIAVVLLATAVMLLFH